MYIDLISRIDRLMVKVEEIQKNQERLTRQFHTVHSDLHNQIDEKDYKIQKLIKYIKKHNLLNLDLEKIRELE